MWATWRHSLYFPPPSAITAQMYHLWFSGPASHLLLTPAATSNILPSLGRVAAGLAIAVAVGVPLGIALGRSARLSAYLEPLLHFGRSVPPTALVSVFLLLFKIGTPMQLASIVYGVDSLPVQLHAATTEQAAG